jgi:hypothetical protein
MITLGFIPSLFQVFCYRFGVFEVNDKGNLKETLDLGPALTPFVENGNA